jgi:hypothetical protein
LPISQTSYGHLQTGEATRRMAMRLAHWKIPNTGEDCWVRAQLNGDGEQGFTKGGPRVSSDPLTLAESDLDNMVAN